MCIWSERSRCLRLSQLVHFHESVRVLHIHRYTHPHGATNQLPRAISQKQKALSHLSSHCSDKIQIEISRCVKEIMLLWPESIIQKYASALKSLIEVLSRHFGFYVQIGISARSQEVRTIFRAVLEVASTTYRAYFGE